MHEAEKAMTRLFDEVIVLRQQVDSLQALLAEQARTEAALREAKEIAETAERTRSEFIATLSHELRTPLSVILGYVELLLGGEFGRVPVEQQDVLDRIHQNTHQLLELISGLLDLNRLEDGHLPLDLCEIGVSELLRTIEQETFSLCSQSQLNVVWQIDDNLPHVCTDSAKLKMVIKNLIGNAIKFTKAGSVRVETHPHAGGVRICVADTGVGIPEESLPAIFEPFQQLDETHGQGTGLGLHIVKRLLTLLGGSITVESEVGRGSTFCVWVPATHSPGLTTRNTEPLAARQRAEHPRKHRAGSAKSDTTLI